MINSMRPRFVAIFLVVVWVGCALWATDGQMRESDQASLLSGAVELARGTTTWAGNDSYNYDKQYLSYWVVAGALKVSVGRARRLRRPCKYPTMGLYSYSLCLTHERRDAQGLDMVGRDASWLRAVVSGGGLFRDVLVPQSHFRSLSVVFGVGAGKRRQGVGCLVLVFLLSFAAVAARQDVMLLMPLLAILVIPFRTFGGVLKNPTLWALAGGCVLAMVIGRLIDPSPTSLPEPFFVPATFVVYLMGGLGGALLLVLLFSAQMVRLQDPGDSGVGVGDIVAVGVLLLSSLYSPAPFRGGARFDRDGVATARCGTVVGRCFGSVWPGAAWVGTGCDACALGHGGTNDGVHAGACGDFGRARSIRPQTGFGRWVAMGTFTGVWQRLMRWPWTTIKRSGLPGWGLRIFRLGKGAIVSSGLASYGRVLR